MKIGDQVFRAVLDTGATLSIVARHLLKTFKKTKTLAIRVGDGRTNSLGRVDVSICLGDETVTQHCRVLDTDAFDIVIGTDAFPWGAGHGTLRWTHASEQAGEALRSQGHQCVVM